MEDTPDDPKAPRRGRPGYDRETVLRRAIELFNRQGYEATSMADLADELGLTKSAIYHHVESREQLLSAALDEALDELTALVEAAADPARADATDAGSRLRTLVHDSVRILVDHLPAVTLLLRVRGNSPVERAALERRRLLDERLAELVSAAATEGVVRSDVAPELVSRLLFGMVNSLSEWYRPDGPDSTDAVARAITTMAFEGILADG